MSTWQQHVDATAPVTGFPPCALTDLSHLGLIRVSGPDARCFLQGQLTNDVNLVTAERAQLSSYCSPKGRMLGSFWIFQRADDLFLQLPRERLDAVMQRLQMFVLRSDVRLDDASGQLARFGLAGECASGLLPGLPAGDDRACTTRDDITVLRLPGDRPRFEVIGPPDSLLPWWDKAAAQAERTGPDFWSLLDIRAGIPTVFDETVEAFVPQMANLQLLDGVSFTKGCYTGQEVVARTQHLGRLKRRMYRARTGADQRPARCTEIYPAGDADAQPAGRIVDSAPAPEGGYEVLAVLQIGNAESDQLHIGAPGGPPLELLALPYAFAPTED